MSHVLIIGAGPAGCSAALTLRLRGGDVTVLYASGGALYGEATVYKIGDYGHSLNYITRYDIDYENYPDTPYYNGDEWLSKDAFDRRYRMVDSAVFVQK